MMLYILLPNRFVSSQKYSLIELEVLKVTFGYCPVALVYWIRKALVWLNPTNTLNTTSTYNNYIYRGEHYTLVPSNMLTDKTLRIFLVRHMTNWS